MIPAVPVPDNHGIKQVVEVKLRPGWGFNERQSTLVSGSGEQYDPSKDLPAASSIVHKTPILLRKSAQLRSSDENELLRYLQVILPDGSAAAEYLEVIGKWPAVERASLSPNVSLP